MNVHGKAPLPEAVAAWVPPEAQRYLVHTELGRSIRALARDAGVSASTVLRQVRKLEARRDDPLIDEALTRLGNINRAHSNAPQRARQKDDWPMIAANDASPALDKTTLEREGVRILRRLSEPGACLAVAADMEKAVVVRDTADGETTRTAVTDRTVAQAMALKDWIAAQPKGQGRIARYAITSTGRAALRRLLAAQDRAQSGFGEASGGFDDEGARRSRTFSAESPLQILSRRRGRDGTAFLAPHLVAAGERLSDDFQVAQIGVDAPLNWDGFLAAPAEPAEPALNPVAPARTNVSHGSLASRARVAAALADLGPGLGDVALRCCCYQEGMETAEKRMGWSARSGKIVLRIALQRLHQHYQADKTGALIG